MKAHFERFRVDGRTPLILEIKPKTHAGLDLLRDRPLTEIVQAYESVAPLGISVVTGRWFGGDLELFADVRDLTELPLLRKDFIVSKRDLQISANYGASAVLLTADLISISQLNRLAELALELDMTPFVEVVDLEQAKKLENQRNIIVAVNNKNIQEREANGPGIQRSLGMISALRQQLPSGASVVSASGVATNTEAVTLLDAGFDALLVGTSILQQADLHSAIQSFANFQGNPLLATSA